MPNFVDPKTGASLIKFESALVNAQTKEVVAPIVSGIPCFVGQQDNYAEAFGWQWNKWETLRSASRNNYSLRDTILRRFRLDQYVVCDKSILECGCGGGDDTEVLLQFPFGEVHSFDLSNAVNRVAKYLHDPRLTLAQASIYEIPYPDGAFDFVYCHRVLQHTPDPIAALRSICKKVKPGGVLFAHVYKRGFRSMLNYKYRYRWLTKIIAHKWIYLYVDKAGPILHFVTKAMAKTKPTKLLALSLIPFEQMSRTAEAANLSEADIIELEKLCTFDALTPKYDLPLTEKEFFGTIEAEGFRINHALSTGLGPLCCAATKL